MQVEIATQMVCVQVVLGITNCSELLRVQIIAMTSVVAVHGLGANPDYAWLNKEQLNQGRSTDVRWLPDLLPQTLKNHQPSVYARIFCFNYQSAWLGKTTSKNWLNNIAQRLLDDLNSQDIQVRFSPYCWPTRDTLR